MPRTTAPHALPSSSLPELQTPLELWGGFECTVNRVENKYLDQFQLSGHDQRLADLDLVADLGIETLRYPVLWERHAPHGLDCADWRFSDERLGRLQNLGIMPIAGLVHHGSGPRSTDLLDPQFAGKLAVYARAVAERYPWIEAWTPINEPLTTARFSGLYGGWYPHAQDLRQWAQMLLHQCQATVLSMRAIHEIIPSARLIQTEDLGKTHATPTLQYQADFENERRWLSFDLLCGRVVPGHPMHGFLTWLGVTWEELAWLEANSCPPDVLGINHYLTSERFLDHHAHHYPPHARGGNGQHEYADVEAVRVCREGTEGPLALLGEAWERYHLPLAVTEAHLGCTREEQARWLIEIWDAAQTLREHGVPVRAVTVWSLIGAWEWNSLLTRCDGHYEPGVFDLRRRDEHGAPRPTALAAVARMLANGERPDHPAWQSPGWWRREARLLYPPVSRVSPAQPKSVLHLPHARPGDMASPLLITGATGTLGRAFAHLCTLRGLPHRLLSRHEMDIADAASVARALDDIEPWAVVNTAGYVRVDDAEREPDACFRENALGPEVLARACASRAVQLLSFSSDLVFDGGKDEPYIESDETRPLNVYGQSKAEAERRVLAALPQALVIRTSAFFGPWDEHNFVFHALRALSRGESFAAPDDAFIAPTYVPDLVHTSLDLLLDGEGGVWHLANWSHLTWADLARRAAHLAGLNAGRVEGRPTASFHWPAPRPMWSVLGSERGALMPFVEDALHRFLRDCQMPWRDESIAQAG